MLTPKGTFRIPDLIEPYTFTLDICPKLLLNSIIVPCLVFTVFFTSLELVDRFECTIRIRVALCTIGFPCDPIPFVGEFAGSTLNNMPGLVGAMN